MTFVSKVPDVPPSHNKKRIYTTKSTVVDMNEDHNGFSDSDDEAQPWALNLNGSDPSGRPTQNGGKWTTEEEIYCAHLIQLFQIGGLADCKRNTTLRAYLADKLHCKPMRITKKYAAGVFDGSLLYLPTDCEGFVSAHLAALRDNYLQPKIKRSHKKKKSSDYHTCTSITAPGCNDDESSAGGSSFNDDLDVQLLTPEDIEVLRISFLGVDESSTVLAPGLPGQLIVSPVLVTTPPISEDNLCWSPINVIG